MTGVVRAPGIGLSGRIDRLAASRPDIVLTAPLMAYLVLLGVTVALPVTWQPVTIAGRGVLSLGVVWLLRRHLPPWGAPHWGIAIVGGVVVAWGWIVGQQVCDGLGLPGRLPLYPGDKVVIDPRDVLGSHHLFWATWWLRMLVAVISVPVVEELFWRGFLLRALIDWQHFERIPLGKFTWFSFLGTALISTLQHPDNWIVSILCWLAFNAVFYWTRSLLCLVLLHGMTNLALYVLVVRVRDWSFW
jgi:CAAX prenyl protease-like protein